MTGAWAAVCVGVGPVLVLVALWPGRVLRTQNDDLANHVRCAVEYAAALGEGQFPPLVAPHLNGGDRVPLFQYYGGTAYLLPGALVAAGVDPYAALRASIIVHGLAGGAALYGLLRRLGVGAASAGLGTAVAQLAPYAGMVLSYRGSYTEFIASQVGAVLGYALLRATQRGDGVAVGAGVVRAVAGAALVWAYLVPIHPVQTLLMSSLWAGLVTVAAVAAGTTVRTAGAPRAAWASAARTLVVTAGLAGVASGWFWWPILRDYPLLRVTGHTGLYDAWTDHPAVLLWPVYRDVPQLPGWAPQVGGPVVVAGLSAIVAVLAIAGRQPRGPGRPAVAVGVVAAAVIGLVVLLCLWHAAIPLVGRALSPLQYTYRLLLPAGMAGGVCAAVAHHALVARGGTRVALGSAGLLGCAVVAVAWPYFVPRAPVYGHDVAAIAAPGFTARDASAYALRGTDFRQLGWVAPDGVLRTDEDLPIPTEGFPTEAELVLRPTVPGAPPPTVWVDGREAPRLMYEPADHDGQVRVRFAYVPVMGAFAAGHRTARFAREGDAPPGEVGWVVTDVAWRVLDEPPALAVRLPIPPVWVRAAVVGPVSSWTVAIPPGRAGLYQLPVCYLPSYAISVNGVRQRPETVNQYLVTVRLEAGSNTVRVEAGPAPVAWAASAITIGGFCAAVCAAATVGLNRRRHKA